MSEDVANTRLGEEKESAASGLLLSVESMQGGERRDAQGADKTDTDKDTQDTGDVLIDVDGTDESEGDGTDGGGDGTDGGGDATDETDTLGDTDGTDAVGGSDGRDS
jgi:hypothetical protein